MKRERREQNNIEWEEHKTCGRQHKLKTKARDVFSKCGPSQQQRRKKKEQFKLLSPATVRHSAGASSRAHNQKKKKKLFAKVDASLLLLDSWTRFNNPTVSLLLSLSSASGFWQRGSIICFYPRIVIPLHSRRCWRRHLLEKLEWSSTPAKKRKKDRG